MAHVSGNAIVPKLSRDFIIVEENHQAILECKLTKIPKRTDKHVSIRWYRNGELITPSDNTKIYVDGNWHRLELNNVTKNDEGIYTLVLISSDDSYYKCILFVKSDPYDNKTYSIPYELRGTVTNNVVRCCNIPKEKDHNLHVTFVENIQRCNWYKNNNRIPQSYPKLFMHLNGTSNFSLLINNTKEKDSGVYSLVALTCDQHYICNFIDVIVGSTEMIKMYNEPLPHVWKTPRFIEVYEKDDVRLVFKVSYDTDTIVEWTKSGEEVKLSDRVKVDMYGNRYIALKLYNVKCSDSGNYYLILRDKVSPCFVTYGKLVVKKYPFSRPMPCEVIKKLVPSVVSIGNGVTFQCAFNIENLKYTYASWMVGKYTVERSNPRFKVMSSGNEFVLHITAALPDMTGEVICQLRQSLPDGKSLYICNSKAYLAVMPAIALEDEKKLYPFAIERNIYNDQGARILITSRPHVDRQPKISDIILYFKFSRMSDSGIFFTVVDDAPKSDVTEIAFSKMSIPNPNMAIVGHWQIEWLRPAQKVWYSIDLCQPNGLYKVIGKTRYPHFEIKDPPEDTLFKFRIRIVRPKPQSNIRNFRFNPQVQKKSKISKKIQPHTTFNRLYVDDMKLNRGSFGVVNFARRCRDNELYITKTMKFAGQVNRSRAILEFDITKRLVHPHTVSLSKGFSPRLGDGIMLMMDYLWGNELGTKGFDNEYMHETDVIAYVRQILLALQYLHAKKIAHLDVNPENIVFVNRNSRMIKLVDFSSSMIVKKPLIVPQSCGNYVPPEIIHSEPVGTYSDMWNVGVLTYWLLTDKHPFRGLSNITLRRNISRGAYRYDEFDAKIVSDRAKSFVSLLLRRYPCDRLTAEKALFDQWITEGPQDGRPIKVQIQSYGGLRILDSRQAAIIRWKRTILAVRFIMSRRTKRNLGEPMSVCDSDL